MLDRWPGFSHFCFPVLVGALRVWLLQAIILGFHTLQKWADSSSPFFLRGHFEFQANSVRTNRSRHHPMSWSQAVEKTVTGLGYELVDVERSAGGLLRVYIDRVPGRAYPTGEHEFVTVEDCEAVTRQLQYVLEVENVDYARLEVSSPGLDRPLKRPEDYARFAGSEVQITLKLPFQGRKKFQGVLHPATEGSGW